ncbi:hypothetical protein AJ88_02735 [Mesorhizobium amorphae CCBAU 01583]|nr:hypothetical protein AJ88_02735 [Mesorhizobium amorphae CCBAU 01583]
MGRFDHDHDSRTEPGQDALGKSSGDEIRRPLARALQRQPGQDANQRELLALTKLVRQETQDHEHCSRQYP